MGDPATPEPKPSKPRKKGPLREFIETIVVAFLLALLIRTFILQVFYIPSASMEPSLLIKDRIIVNKFIYRFQNINRFDVIVFKFPGDPPRDFIKRVVGLPGEMLAVQNGKLLVNGKKVPEHHTFRPDHSDFGPLQIPPGNYFVMGDNRSNSSDSRVWGPLPQSQIIGKAFLRIWPLPRMGLISSVTDLRRLGNAREPQRGSLALSPPRSSRMLPWSQRMLNVAGHRARSSSKGSFVFANPPLQTFPSFLSSHDVSADISV